MDWTPTRAAGLARLKEFLPKAGLAYAAQKGFDRGPQDRANVSALSPWLRCRLATEAETAAAILAAHGLARAAAFIEELCRRAYWKGFLERRPSIWWDFRDGVEGASAALADSPGLSLSYAAAVEGRTGVAPFDVWARELQTHGYLHHQARASFASIWIFTLGLPWELGADFFLRHLLDADPAVNTLSWRWAAGLHPPGKTHLVTPDAIAVSTEGRLACPPGVLASEAAPVDGYPNPSPSPMPPDDEVPDEAFALLIHEDDLDPFGVDPALQAAKAIAGAPTSRRRGARALGRPADAFARGAMEDALARAGKAVQLAPQLLEPTPDAVLVWARSAGVRAVAAPYAPVGPARELLDGVEEALAGAGLRLHRCRRAWDSQFWPQAGAGFFGFRAAIPDTLRALGFKVSETEAAAFAKAAER